MQGFPSSFDPSHAVCFTGHRTLPRARLQELQDALSAQIDALAQTGMTDFLAGGAVGFDMLAAVCVLNLQYKYPQLRLFLILPCNNHTLSWKEWDLDLFSRICKRADGIHYVTDAPYQTGCMQMRNRFLVDHASVCISYQTSQRGGTAFTVSYAQKKGLPIINMADKLA